MARAVSRGALIVLEGCDRSGKTTQCAKLVEALNKDGLKSECMRFPDRTSPTGQVINSYLEQSKQLEDHAVHLLFTANRWEAVPKMKEVLKSGTTLVIDRYSYSGVAYTASKEGMDLHWCRTPEVGLPKPDLVLYFKLSPEEAAKRAAYGGEIYERKEFQDRVAANYELLKEPDWQIIDASKTIEEVHNNLKSIVTDAIRKVGDRELGQLWVNTLGRDLQG